jgi:hypothetical protein
MVVDCRLGRELKQTRAAQKLDLIGRARIGSACLESQEARTRGRESQCNGEEKRMWVKMKLSEPERGGRERATRGVEVRADSEEVVGRW